MNCIVVLINTTNNKYEKTCHISADTYKDCEQKVKEKNSKLKNKNKYWTITTINN